MSQPIVIKVGGSILNQPDDLRFFLQTIKQIVKKQPLVIIHGGGWVVDKHLDAANLTSEKIDGIRVTKPEHMPIIAGALAGAVNKNMVASANALGITSLGLSLHDGNMVSCLPDKPQFGQVGIPQPNQVNVLNQLLGVVDLIFIASIGQLADGTLVNVNADDAAVAIADLLQAQLILLTDVAGVKDGDSKVLSSLSHPQAQELIAQGVINGGMVAKVRAAFHAANLLRRSIAVASWKTPEDLLLLQQGRLPGTRIVPEQITL
ncbi:acetylglutamate kinase [Thalassotalea aquiviva]|uniref:acetylglutamate kinase n=1 Tax=Thalassotalea aquiviva TaxID=3242415 RepID=UPI00352A6565